MSSFWSGWIIFLTLTCLALVIWVLFSTRKTQRPDLTEETTGHHYDGIEELDNPLPHWWFLMFVATLVFGAGYLLLYPGLGKWEGFFGWTSTGELERHELKHSRRYAPEFARYAATPIEELINNPRALKMGQRIYMNNCALCHTSDARGTFGFPNLTDNDWLYGGTPDAIKTTLLMGRQGQMPAWVAIIGEKGVNQVTHYVRTLSRLETRASNETLAAGKAIYDTTCSVCHAPDGTGNQALGAPNLTNNTWLYGSSHEQIAYTIRSGRNGVMPAWKDILGEEKVHLVAAYVYSLSHKAKNEE
ncbi:cytochrome-c oxidase, cbb3-type subunit III [Endozoicomonas sp. Mp262]|uniref:cytochrome-c oxidase, cbb3-type subunit III n=1 Tax=Endozoicomonas sp. Mp262 TaxID=2919499 RepID=UPI0021DAC98E